MIDGEIGTEEWEMAGELRFEVRDPESSGGRSVEAVLLVMNDSLNLYLAVQFATAHQGNTAVFHFDDDLKGFTAQGDDVLLMNPASGVGFYDEHRTARSLGETDIANGGTNDGEAAFQNTGGVTKYEFSHPLDSGDYEHDFSLRAGDVIAVNLSIRLIDADTDLDYPENTSDSDLVRAGSTLEWPKIRILNSERTANIGPPWNALVTAAILRRSARESEVQP